MLNKIFIELGLGVLLVCCSTNLTLAANPEIADNSTLYGKVMAGYEGWYSAPSDGSQKGQALVTEHALGKTQTGQYSHWTRDSFIPLKAFPVCPDGTEVKKAPATAQDCTPTGTNLSVDMWPDLSEMDADEKYPTLFTLPGGAVAYVYSNANAKTVDRHFRWMKEYGIDGVYAQRFFTTQDPVTQEFKNRTLQNIRQAAEQNGRVFSIRYDLHGAKGETLVEDVKKDWMFLVDTMGITGSPSYLHHKGKPLLAITGLGYKELDNNTPQQAQELISWFTHDAPPKYQVTLQGIVPAHWRELKGDSQSDPRWADIYLSYDVITPWLVSRFKDEKTFNTFEEKIILPDMEYAQAHHKDYMPVVFPGFSNHSLYGKPLNYAPRMGGQFLWMQLHAHFQHGAQMIFGAQFDEIQEGTALYKTAPTRAQSPQEVQLVTLDMDGYAVPSDWYLCLMGEAGWRLKRHVELGAHLPQTFVEPQCHKQVGTGSR